MPQIRALRIIGGELWAHIGKPGEFQSGVALLTPQEQLDVRKKAFDDVLEVVNAFKRGEL